MRAAISAELLKQRSTRSMFGLLAAMTFLLLLVVLVHGLGLAADTLATRSDQLSILYGWGGVFGSLFAGLAGALAVTTEFRYGTIRPTLLVNPARRQVVLAKVTASMSYGASFGLIAGMLTASLASGTLHARGLPTQLDGADFASVVMGATVAASLWGCIGVAVGTVVRDQVPALVGMVVWSLFVENLLVGDIAGVGAVGRFLPGAAAKAVTGQDSDVLLSAPVALVVLTTYAMLAAALGMWAIDRRDVA